MESAQKKVAQKLLGLAMNSKRHREGCLRALRKIEVFRNECKTRTTAEDVQGEQITGACFYATDEQGNAGYVVATPNISYFTMDAVGDVFKPEHSFEDVFARGEQTHPPGNAFILNHYSGGDNGRVQVKDMLERTYTLYYPKRLHQVDI